MKTPSNELFQFVKSLESHEKTYIKKCFSRDTNMTKNAQLFDYLRACKQYDEHELLKQLTFLNQKSIKHNKYNLYHYLLKTLEHYYAETDEEQRLNKLLFQIQLLRKKRFYKKAKQLLVYATEQAKKNNFFLLQMQLQAEAEFLAFVLGETARFAEFTNRSIEHTHLLFEHYKTKQLFLLKRFELITILDTPLKEQQQQQQIKTIYQETLHSKEQKEYNLLPLPLQLQILYIEYFCLYLLHDYTAAKKCFIFFLDRYLQQNMRLQEHQSYLMFHLVNGTSICIKDADEKLLLQLDKRTDVVFLSIPLKNKTHIIINSYLKIKGNIIAFMCHDHNYELAKKAAEKLWIPSIQKSITADTQKVFLGNLCRIYLCCKEPKKALVINNLIRNNKLFLNVRQDIDYAYNIIELAIFYDLRMWGNLRSALGTFMRDDFLKDQSKIYQQLIYLFGELTKIKDKTIVKQSFLDIIKKIYTIKKTDKKSLSLLEDNEIKYWLESKIENKSLLEISREK